MIQRYQIPKRKLKKYFRTETTRYMIAKFALNPNKSKVKPSTQTLAPKSNPNPNPNPML